MGAELRHPKSVNWLEYFDSIKKECPWSFKAYQEGLIDIVVYQGKQIPLGKFKARMYMLSAPDVTVRAISSGFDYEDEECEWLYSYPGYGEYATPVSVLIQQNRAELNRLRKKHDY